MSAGAAPGLPATGAPADSGRRWGLPVLPAKYYSASLITLILIVGQSVGDIVGGYDRMALALGTACAAELLLGKLLRGNYPSLLSAYISGNSVAILTKPAAGLLWPFWIGSLLAICSKYVLTYRNRHLWNPTNFSIAALLLVAPNSMSLLSHQWGNDVVTWVLLAVGLFVVMRARVASITLGYVGFFIAFAALRAAVRADAQLGFLAAWINELAPLTGPMYMLLIFFMLTDPRTTVTGIPARLTVVFLIAALECAIRLLPLTDWRWLDPLLTAPPIFALFVVGPAAFWLELRRRPAKATGA